uniref:Uncharacterized protein n=1 Tax=Oryza brachyantha TaxID=4533 RepID=J3LQ14_ORYBR
MPSPAAARLRHRPPTVVLRRHPLRHKQTTVSFGQWGFGALAGARRWSRRLRPLRAAGNRGEVAVTCGQWASGQARSRRSAGGATTAESRVPDCGANRPNPRIPSRRPTAACS